MCLRSELKKRTSSFPSPTSSFGSRKGSGGIGGPDAADAVGCVGIYRTSQLSPIDVSSVS